MRRPPVVIGLAIGTVVALAVAIGLIVFSVNPTTESNQEEILGQRGDIAAQQRTLHSIICAQAQSTANAYRFRSLTPSGKIESIQHFLTRMQAQEQTLKLSRGLECESAPGFP